MASEGAAGRIKHEAERRVFGVMEAHGQPRLIEDLEALGTGTPRDPWHLAAVQATMLAGLASIIEEQDRRITALENAAPATSTAAVDTDEETAHADGDERPALSGELRELLANAGYADDQAVREASDEDLLKIKGVGPAKLGEIRAATAAEGA